MSFWSINDWYTPDEQSVASFGIGPVCYDIDIRYWIFQYWILDIGYWISKLVSQLTISQIGIFQLPLTPSIAYISSSSTEWMYRRINLSSIYPIPEKKTKIREERFFRFLQIVSYIYFSFVWLNKMEHCFILRVINNQSNRKIYSFTKTTEIYGNFQYV